jgi:GT2 family glycosyltransferase
VNNSTTEAPPALSVVVVSHDHREHLERSLPALQDALAGCRFEALLIDNTGGEGLAGLVSVRWPWLPVIVNAQPQSFAANVNAGIARLSGGRYVVLWNPDVQARAGTFETLVSFMDTHPGVAIAGPRLLNPDGSHQPSARAFSTPGVVLARGLGLDRLFPRAAPFRRYLLQDLPADRPSMVDWITGAVMIVRRAAVEEVGGMDERYRPAYSEDQDWCCRMWRAGWEVAYVPAAVAVHDHQRAGVRRPWSAMGRAQQLNALRMFLKFRGRLSRRPAGPDR